MDRPKQPAHQVRHPAIGGTRHTRPKHKSQPCKRACLVPTLPGHTLLRWTQTFSSPHQDEGRTYNIGACFYAGRRSNNELHIAISYYPADEFLFSFLLLTSTSIFQLGCGSGLDIIKYQHSRKPYRCA